MQNIQKNTADNTGGIYTIYFIPVSDVFSIPDVVRKTIDIPVSLATGKSFYAAQVTLDSFSYKETQNSSDEGNSYPISIGGFVAGDSSDLSDLFEEMAIDRFIVIGEDNNNKKRLIGTINNPVRFKADFETASKFSGLKGWNISFYGTFSDVEGRPPFYLSSFSAYADPEATTLNDPFGFQPQINTLNIELAALQLEVDNLELSNPLISDIAYSSLWNGDTLHAPSKNAVYDKIQSLTTSDIVEGSNLYYTSARFDSAFSAKSTSNLSEGSNLYFTDARVDSRISSHWSGAIGGFAPLDGSLLIPSAYLPSYVDDVLEFANLASFPGTGETGKIYVALDTNKTYRWGGSSYTYITSGAVDSVNGQTGIITLTTSNITEGTNLYYTSTRFNSAFGSKTTSDLSEGTNLYFTNARALSATSTAYESALGNPATNGYILSSTTAGVRTWIPTPLTSQWVTTGSDIYYSAGNVMVGTNAAPSAKIHTVDTGTSSPRGIILDQYSTGTNSSQANLRKARGTFAVPTTIVTSDVVSNINSWAHDGTNFLNTAAIRVTSVGTIGTGRTPSKMDFYTMTDVATGVLTLALTIDQSQDISFANMTSGSVLFAGTSGKLSQNNANFYFASGLLNVGTAGDQTGTDHFNIYNNGDSYAPNSANSANTAASAAWTVSTSRGTGLVPTESLDGDFIGSFAGWAYNGSAYVSSASMRTYVEGTTSTNRGGRLEFWTKANGGAMTLAYKVDSNQIISVSNKILNADGTSSLPSYSFTSSTNSGMFWSASNSRVVLSVQGTNVLNLSNTEVIINASSPSLRLATSAVGTDQVGTSFTIGSGAGTGAGAASSLIFQTPSTLSSGTTTQTNATRLTISNAGIIVGAGGNINVLPNNNQQQDLGSSTKAWNNAWLTSIQSNNTMSITSGQTTATKPLTITSSNSTNFVSSGTADVILRTGNTTNASAGNVTGNLSLFTGDATNGTTGYIAIYTGAATAGTKSSIAIGGNFVPTVGFVAEMRTNAIADVGFVIRGLGAAGSYTQTGDLQMWQSYDGTTPTTRIKIDANFKLILNAASATGLNGAAAGMASLNIPSGVAPTTPSDGDIWYDGTNIKLRVGGTTKTFTLT